MINFQRWKITITSTPFSPSAWNWQTDKTCTLPCQGLFNDIKSEGKGGGGGGGVAQGLGGLWHGHIQTNKQTPIFIHSLAYPEIVNPYGLLSIFYKFSHPFFVGISNSWTISTSHHTSLFGPPSRFTSYNI